MNSLVASSYSNDWLRMLYFVFYGHLMASVFYDLIIRNAFRLCTANQNIILLLIGLVFGILIFIYCLYSIKMIYRSAFNNHDAEYGDTVKLNIKIIYGVLLIIILLKIAYIIFRVCSSTVKLEDTVVCAFQLIMLILGSLINYKIAKRITKKRFIF